MFPVYGPASFGDSFGAPRPNVEGGWHHGEDIFSPSGRAAPRGRRRNAPHDRLQPDRGLPALAPRRRRERVLLRAPLRVLAARRRGPARPGGRRHRLRGRHRRRGGDSAPPLRDPSIVDGEPGLRRSRGAVSDLAGLEDEPTTSRSPQAASTRPRDAGERPPCRLREPCCSRPRTSRRRAAWSRARSSAPSSADADGHEAGTRASGSRLRVS